MNDKIGKYYWVRTEAGKEIAFKRDSGLWEMHGIDCLEDCKEAILEIYGEVANGVVFSGDDERSRFQIIHGVLQACFMTACYRLHGLINKNIKMKALIPIILVAIITVFVIKYSKKQRKYKADCEFIDSHSRCIPLLQPIMVFKFTKEECDSIKMERQKELDRIVYRAKYHSKEPVDTYFASLHLLENDIKLDAQR